MSRENLPFFNELKVLNYSLHSFSGDFESALYMKGDLAIKTRKEDNTVELFAVLGLAKISISFSFPHKRFAFFEAKILELLEGHLWLN